MVPKHFPLSDSAKNNIIKTAEPNLPSPMMRYGRPTKIAEHRHTLTGLTVHHFGALSVPIYNHTRQLLGTLDVRV